MTDEPQKKPPNPNGPDFIHKLKDKHIMVEFHNGEELSGVLLKFNRYELLFLEDETTAPIILMKNFIAAIWCDEDTNPFTKPPEVTPPCP